MTMLRFFFRPRRVVLPTSWGWLAILLAGMVGGVLVARHAYGFLAPHEPARGVDGRGARVLVVEGWLYAAELQQAVDVIQHGHYDRVITTGGPIEWWDGAGPWATYADRAAAYLSARGNLGVAVRPVGAPASAQDRTFLSAVVARDALGQWGVRPDAIDLFSSGVHARRSRMVFQLAFGKGVEIGVIAARPSTYDPAHWWAGSTGFKTVLGESLGLAWTACCFWPPPAGSHEERWAVPRAASASLP